MKINQDPTFAPITIVLETYDEAMALLEACLGNALLSTPERRDTLNDLVAFLGTEAKL